MDSIYASNEANEGFSPMLRGGTVVVTIGVGDLPLGLAVNPAGTRAYVANAASGTVSIIDTATDTWWPPSGWATCPPTSP